MVASRPGDDMANDRGTEREATRALYRIEIVHEHPAKAVTLQARSVMARTVHGLSDHDVVEQLAERSTPRSLSFTLRASADVIEGLLIVATALPHVATWEIEVKQVDERGEDGESQTSDAADRRRATSA
jgi:hypothetical protein